MAARRKFFFVAWWIASGLAPALVAQQSPLAPARPTAARILLLPRRIVSGERATLAVLDVNGRLAPGVTIRFSNGDHVFHDSHADGGVGALDGNLRGSACGYADGPL